jgi:hypothetical protein
VFGKPRAVVLPVFEFKGLVGLKRNLSIDNGDTGADFVYAPNEREDVFAI